MELSTVNNLAYHGGLSLILFTCPPDILSLLNMDSRGMLDSKLTTLRAVNSIKYDMTYKSTVKRLLMFGGMQVIVAIVWFGLFQALRSPAEHYEVSDGQNAASAYEPNNSPRVSKAPTALYEIKSQTIREVSAYNTGDVNQGSGDPCISANGDDICEALEKGQDRCAANFVPFGTKLLLESLDRSWRFQCVVVDRMNKRYRNRVDIAMKKDEKPRAIKFGVQELQVSILEDKQEVSP